jgi:hypothetical protein
MVFVINIYVLRVNHPTMPEAFARLKYSAKSFLDRMINGQAKFAPMV